MKKLLVIVALSLGFTSVSHANLLLEPYLGYEMGKTTSSGTESKTELVNLGGRIGWASPIMLWLALDVNLGMNGKVKPDGSADQDATRNSYYAVAGLDFPILVRGWVGYGFTNELKLDNGKYEGTGMKLGVGFTGLPFVSLNLEYLTDSYDKFDGASLSTKTELSSYMLSVSLPLEF